MKDQSVGARRSDISDAYSVDVSNSNKQETWLLFSLNNIFDPLRDILNAFVI